jgi:hypothetical protein
MTEPLPSTRSWLPDWPDRTPLLGLHTTNRTTIAAELAAADSHGIDFFEMLWYSPDVVGSCAQGEWPTDPNMRPCTNTPIAIAVNDSGVWPPLTSSGGSGTGIRFSVSYSNDLWKADEYVGVAGRSRWRSFAATWIQLMGHPRYLKLDGRPVLKILGPYNFLARQCGGNATLAQQLIGELRTLAVAAGVGDPLLGGGWISEDDPVPDRRYQGVDFDYTGNYNSAARSAALGACTSTDVVLPWSQLAAYNDGGRWRNHSTGDAVPWVPNVDAGYDVRPNGNRSGQCTFGEPTLAEWTTYLQSVKAAIEAPGARLGYPAADGGVHRAVTLYAWNEFAEGGIIAPTGGQGWTKLQGIAAVFGGEQHRTSVQEQGATGQTTAKIYADEADAGLATTPKATAGSLAQPKRSISWWWDDVHHASADGLIAFCTKHRDIVTRVMMLCDVFTCIAADWSNASAPKGTCTPTNLNPSRKPTNQPTNQPNKQTNNQPPAVTELVTSAVVGVLEEELTSGLAGPVASGSLIT